MMGRAGGGALVSVANPFWTNAGTAGSAMLLGGNGPFCPEIAANLRGRWSGPTAPNRRIPGVPLDVRPGILSAPMAQGDRIVLDSETNPGAISLAVAADNASVAGTRSQYTRAPIHSATSMIRKRSARPRCILNAGRRDRRGSNVLSCPSAARRRSNRRCSSGAPWWRRRSRSDCPSTSAARTIKQPEIHTPAPP